MILVIYGAHGAGKTTLVKNILLSDGQNLKECECSYGKYTISENEHYVAVGKYSIKCGGADSLKGTEYYYKMLEKLVIDHPESTILIEGIFLSVLFSKPLDEFLKLKYDYGVKIIQVFLFVDNITSYSRVYARNGKQPNPHNIKAKVNSVFNTMKKFQEINEFPTIAINTVGKTQQEVYNEFNQAINNETKENHE